MGRRPRQVAHLARVAPRRVPNAPPAGFTSNVKSWAFSILVAGATYTAIAKFLLGIGVIPFSAAAVYAAQVVLIPGIVAYARTVCERNRAAMKDRAVVGIDGSWNHRRNGSAHIIDMIDVDSGRVVDFEMVERRSLRRPGNYEGSSNGMEVEAMRRMVTRWEDDEKVETVITDQDSKLAKVIRESGWNVEHEFDANHAKKSLNRAYEKLGKEEHGHLYGLGQRLKNWFNNVLHLGAPREKKVELWENAYEHYCGRHEKCPNPGHQGYHWAHRDDPAAQETLRHYLAEGTKVIRKVDPTRGSTQWNESFHAVKAKFVDKRLHLPESTQSRFALAVISHSGGPHWQEDLRQSLDLEPLPPECATRLRAMERQRTSRNETRRTPEARHKRNQDRESARARNASNAAGRDDYRMSGND